MEFKYDSETKESKDDIEWIKHGDDSDSEYEVDEFEG